MSAECSDCDMDLVYGEWPEMFCASCRAEDQLRDAESHREFLWKLLDNIDTMADACKGDLERFYSYAMTQVNRRFEISTSDGYEIQWLPRQAVTESDALPPKSASGLFADSTTVFYERQVRRVRRFLRWLWRFWFPRRKPVKPSPLYSFMKNQFLNSIDDIDLSKDSMKVVLWHGLPPYLGARSDGTIIWPDDSTVTPPVGYTGDTLKTGDVLD